MKNLANKYRPKTFEQVVGQENIMTILKKQVEEGVVKNGYLFIGSAGTGKTTTARILANSLNEYRGTGIIEVDAASNNGVENIRNLIENAKFKSIDSEYKIFIIDEVHMLSIGAFNALLKILEEPPKHVVFIACTTEPHKIPATVLSRLQRFDFKRVPINDIVRLLSNICEKERIEYDIDGLRCIAELSHGGVRDAISIVDMCSHEKVTKEIVHAVVGKVDNSIFYDFLESLHTDKSRSLVILNNLWNNGIDLKKYMLDFTEYLVEAQTQAVINKETSICVKFKFEVINQMIKSLFDLNFKIKYEANAKYIIEGWVLVNDWTK